MKAQISPRRLRLRRCRLRHFAEIFLDIFAGYDISRFHFAIFRLSFSPFRHSSSRYASAAAASPSPAMLLFIPPCFFLPLSPMPLPPPLLLLMLLPFTPPRHAAAADFSIYCRRRRRRGAHAIARPLSRDALAYAGSADAAASR